MPLPEGVTVRYVIDTKGSTFVVKTFATGLLSAFGHEPKIAIRDFQGSVSFIVGDNTLSDAELRLKIRADSLEVADDISEKDRQEIHRRMRTEVLDTQEFPEIVYECSRVTASGESSRYWASLSGFLTLRGIARPLPVSAKVLLDNGNLRAIGEFTLRQTAFGIQPPSALAGAIQLKDELKFSFNIVARAE